MFFLFESTLARAANLLYNPLISGVWHSRQELLYNTMAFYFRERRDPMSQDRFGIICLCGQFKQEEGIHPLTIAEFRDLSALLGRHGKTPGSLFRMSPGELISMGISPEGAQRLFALLDRFPVIETILGSYKSMGIHILTPVEPFYPSTLKTTLGINTPPVLCCAGELSLTEQSVIGFVGARDISPIDGEFAKQAVGKVIAQGYGVVSGGARGVDSVSEEAALQQGGFVVEFPAISIFQRLRKDGTNRHLEDKRLLLATPVAPHTGFSTNLATTRNRMIYAHSVATVVVRATVCRGGTWSGATDALKRNLCPILCRDHPYEGNQGLIQAGALPIDNDWNGTLPNGGVKPIPSQECSKELPEQVFLFE